ncbi:MAG: hypothetical protein KDD94_15470, partial [Calditrichaeota bacterium]|nr:hypothetical protein [Calditrichota bacterium]
MKILYEVKNRSADSIFIFNPNIYYQTDMKFFDYLSERVSQTNIRYDEKTNEYLFYKLGGHYTYQLGSYMGSMVNMIGIAPKQTFSCNFLLTVLKGQILKHTMNQFWGLEDKIIG